MRNLNKPNRYNVASIQAQQTLGGDVMQSDEEGQYVTWRDYAWLLAEVGRLRESSFVTAVPSDDYEKLKAEVERLKEGNECLDKMHEKEMARSAYLCEQVERLRKAGDVVAWGIQLPLPRCQIDNIVSQWNAAKEGKQS